MSSSPPQPGLRNQAGLRTAFRVLGLLLVVSALALIVTAGLDFFGSMNSFEGPHKFWMFFVGLPLLAVGVWMLQAGFLGLGSRFLAGETAPVLRDTASYLTGGKGILNVGATGSPGSEPASGPYCRSCGTRNDADARFCDSCGTAMA
jgi:hypothetical protein